LPNISSLIPNDKSRKLFGEILLSNYNDDFDNFLIYYISKYIPIAYLEGLQLIIKLLAESNLPNKPKKIFTSNAFFNNDQFQIYLAENQSSELIFAQHGGAVGMSEIMPGEDHQIKLANKYISWGWRDERKNIIPVGALSIIGKKLNHDKFGDLLYVTVPIRRFSFRIQSWPTGANQSDIFFNTQLSFINNLKSRIYDRTVIRINKNMDDTFGSNYIKKFKESLTNIRIDIQGKNIFKVLDQYRLVVYSYNSTGYLELMALNYPVIIMWDEKFFELRETSKNDFDELRKCGIMQDTPIDAANFVESVWDSVDLWWSSDLVQEAKNNFLKKYALKPNFFKLLRVI
jgi:putative transferase (TIGR04331 family)